MKTSLSIALAFMALGNLTLRANGPTDPVLQPCLVKVKDEVEIPAQKEGVLTEMAVIEGSSVQAGAKIAVIDDREAKAAVEVSRFAHEAAQARAADDIEGRFAAKSAEVAKKDWDRDLEANNQVPGSVPEIEVEQKRLMYEKSILQMEKADKDQHLAALDAKVKKAERDAAEVALEKRSIFAPFDGEVVTLHREKSEWVNPGDPILTLMRFDKLYAEVFVNANQFDREELLGKQVTVTVPRAHGKEISLSGVVMHVSQLIQSGGNYKVRAEVANVKEGKSWAIQPSASPRGKMTIHLQQ
jgi:multidrug efflux pump subunit AcrA (membrane-fusion protein)